MDWVLAHLVLNHFPIILLIMGAGASVVALAVPRIAAWGFVYTCLMVAGFLSPFVLLTGSRAEETVEETWFVEEEVLEEHEETGEKAAWVFLLIGFGAAAARRIEKLSPERARVLRLTIAVAGVGGALLAGYTGFLGGRIVHGSSALLSPPAGSSQPGAEEPSSPLSH
jgi:uncharacterized membrane protein